VVGFTITSALRQSNRLASSARLTRVAASMRRGRAPRLDVQRQLTAQEQVLGADGIGGTEQQPHPPNGVFYEPTRDQREGEHVCIVPQRHFWRLEMHRTEYLRTTPAR
jgi:hypothetical protein